MSRETDSGAAKERDNSTDSSVERDDTDSDSETDDADSEYADDSQDEAEESTTAADKKQSAVEEDEDPVPSEPAAATKPSRTDDEPGVTDLEPPVEPVEEDEDPVIAEVIVATPDATPAENTGSDAPPVKTALAVIVGPVEADTDVPDIDVPDTDVPPPGGDIPSPAELAMLAFTRREIGTDTQDVAAVIPDASIPKVQQAQVQTIGSRAVGLDPVAWIAGVVRDIEVAVNAAGQWIRTYVNVEPWINGSAWLPSFLRPFVFHQSPVAAPMQVELDLDKGFTSSAIPFIGYDADGGRLLYSVPAKGMPGGPAYGTVVVDNLTGTFTYSPDQDFVGTDTFSFIVSDDTTPHVHAWENLFNAAFGLFGTSFDGGHRDTATVTVFNGVAIKPDPDVAEYTDITGDFSVLTYNVADLFFPFSSGAWPRIPKTLEIGKLINAFDIVNVQQDVSYHPFLLATALFPDQTAPKVPTWLWPIGMPFSDGLNSFSAYDIESLTRHGWDGRADNIFAPTGFTYSRMHIAGGSSVDVYNVDTNSAAMTSADLAQLSAFIERQSLGRAVIVTGDFDQLYSDTGQTLSQFVTANGLTDAWVELEYSGTAPVNAPTCDYADACEQSDKIFYRDAALLDPDDPTSSPVQLQATAYTNEGERFVNALGRDLSDSRPQSVMFSYSVDAVGPMNVDLENWMANIPGIADLPLTQLPIPGTHDSGTYGITPNSEWALTGISDFGVLAQLPEFIQDLIVKPIAAGWSKTQATNLYDQFEDGIRYVDLRLSNEPGGEIYIEHGLRGPLADAVIDDIARFAGEHPQEVLVVYMQRFTNFSPETHDAFVAELEAKLGARMAPSSLGTSATLNDLWAIDKNIILVYNNGETVAEHQNLWANDTLFRPWYNPQTVKQLLAQNVRNFDDRPSNAIWGLFGEPTPDTSNIVAGIFTLGPQTNHQFMWNVHGPVQQWLRVDFKQSVNLVTADWYNEFWPAGSSYVRDVIGVVYETTGERLSGAEAAAAQTSTVGSIPASVRLRFTA